MVDCEATRSAFEGLIKKPTLTDTLLNRPPFKFILDVVANTITSTGYLKSDFPKEQLDPAALTDKNAKLAFLEKLIKSVDDGALSHVKAAKIAAGKDPENTNELLVVFANKARQHSSSKTSKKSSSSYSKEETKQEDKKKRTSSVSEKDKEKKSSSSEKTRSRDSDKKEKTDKKRSSSKDTKGKERSKSRDPKDKEKKPKKSDENKPKEKKEKKKESPPPEPEPSSSPLPEQTELRRRSVELPGSRRSSRDLTVIHAQEDDEGYGEASTSKTHSEMSERLNEEKMSPVHDSGVSDLAESPRPAPPREREFQRPGTAAARPQTSMGRPGTAAARPAPPKLKKKHIATNEEQTQATPEPTGLIITEEPEPSKEENFVVEEEIEEEHRKTPDLVIDAQAGGLVSKMMETKAEIEEGQAGEDLDEDDEFLRQKGKVDVMQKTLQNVTRTAHPLARLLDFAQEDLDSMVRELEQWRSETRTNEAELKDREAMGINDAHKLSNTLSQLDDEIRSVQSALTTAKARITANEENIDALMASI